MKKKWLGITLALLVVVVAAVAAVVTLGDTKADAADGIKISVEKTQFALNEGIEVTVTGIDETLQTHDLEIRLERDILLAEADHANRSEYNGYRQYFDIGKDARDGSGALIPTAETMKVTFQNGGRYHPTDGGTANIPAGTYTIWIIDYTVNKAIGNKVYVSVSEITLSTEKTEFLYGEPIEVTVSGLIEEAYYTGGKWHDLEFRLENRVMDEDEGFKWRATYHQYFDIGDGAKDESGKAMTSIPETRTWTFQNGGIKHPTAGGTTSIPAGAYTLWILDFTNSIVVSNKVDILVYDISISTDKTEYIQGEKIAVDFSGVNNHSSASTKDIEIRFESGWGLDPIGFAARRGASVAYADLGKDCTAGKVENVYVGDAGTKTFPDQDGRYKANNSNKYTVGLGYPAGKYTIWVLDYTQAHICSNKIEITIREAQPTLELDKDTYYYGEPITVNYSEITDYMMSSSSHWFQLDLFKKGQVPGQVSNSGAYGMYNKDGSVDMRGGEDKLIHSGSITFPYDDTEDKGKFFPLAPGEYYICIRKDNSIVGEKATFTVMYPEVEAGKSTFAFGENITVNFSNIYPDIKNGLELRMYPEQYTLGRTQSLAYTIMVSKDGDTCTLLNGKDGSLTFPADDDRDPKLYSTYPVGTYKLVLVDGGGIVRSNEYTFTINKPDTTVQPELKNSIAMHYTVVCDDDVNGEVLMQFAMNDYTVTLNGVAGDAEGGKKTFKFVFDNILPQQMGDEITATLIIDGKVVYSYDAYSLLNYATKKLASDKAEDVAAHDIIVAMLNYGAEAQLYFDYKTDALVNDSLSEAQKDLPSIKEIDAVAAAVSGTKVDGYAWKAATLDLQSTLAFRLKFEAADINSVVITDGQKSWSLATNPECFLQGAGNTWYFYYKNIMAHQFGKTFEITMVVDDLTAQTVAYSVNTYISYIGSKDTSTVDTICQALYAFGLEANKYSA